MKKSAAFVIFITSLSLSACKDDASVSSTSKVETGGYAVTTVSGAKMAMDGTYARPCVAGGSNSVRESIEIVVNVWAYYYRVWNSNTSCSGAADTTQSVIGTLSGSSTNIATTGWVDSNSFSTTTPAAANGSGSLAVNETATLLTITITQSDYGHTIGSTGKLFHVIDDTAMPVIRIYQDDDADLNYQVVDVAYTKQ